MSRLLGVVEQLYGELNSRSLVVYDDALVVVPGDTAAALVRNLAAGAAGALGPAGIAVGALAERPQPEPPPEPELLAASGYRGRLIRVAEMASARLGRSLLGLRRDLVLDLVTGERVVLRWPPLAPRSRDKLVLPVLRAALGDRLGSSA